MFLLRVLFLCIGLIPAFAAAGETFEQENKRVQEHMDAYAYDRQDQQESADPVDDVFDQAILGLFAFEARRQALERQREQEQSSEEAPQYLLARANHPEELNLRHGSGLEFDVVTIMRGNARQLKVYGCTEHDGERAWCVLDFGPYRGWASSKYLVRDDGSN